MANARLLLVALFESIEVVEVRGIGRRIGKLFTDGGIKTEQDPVRIDLALRWCTKGPTCGDPTTSPRGALLPVQTRLADARTPVMATSLR